MKLVCIIACVLALTVSCSRKPDSTWEPVGAFITCDAQHTPWNGWEKSRVETTEAVFIIREFMSAKKGQLVYLSDNGRIGVVGSEQSFKVLGL